MLHFVGSEFSATAALSVGMANPSLDAAGALWEAMLLPVTHGSGHV